MNEISYEEALKYFQSHEFMWQGFMKGIGLKREAYYADLKRNMETPNCNERCDAKIIGAMTAIDDLMIDFQLPIKDETESQKQ